jgi:sugar/nucleoside kinase (ribokinase family)
MKNNKIDVCAIGALAVDYYGMLSEMPPAGGKVTADSYEVHPGGVAGNVLTQCARLNIPCGWLGKIGTDPAGKTVVNEFEKEGIDYSHAEIIPDAYSMFTWIMVNRSGERTIIMFPNILNDFSPDDVAEKHADYIRGAQIFQGEACALKLAPVLEAMKIAKEAGVKTVFDLDVLPSHFIEEVHLGTREELRQVLELTDILVPCKAAAAELLGTNDVKSHISRLMDFGPKTVAITLGAEGCIITDEKETIAIPGYDVTVKDTTGAGDAFHGGLIYSLLKGFPKEKIGAFANACGALCCTQVGARAMGTLEEVEQLFNSEQIR